MNRPNNFNHYFSSARKKVLQHSYAYLTSYPKIGFPILRFHCNLRPDFTDTDPLKSEWIHPSLITGISNYHPRRAYGVVAPGDWDMSCTPIENLPAYEGVKAYIEEDDESHLRKIFNEHVEDHSKGAWGHSSTANFDLRLNEIDDLYYSMKRHGFLSQVQLLEKDLQGTVTSNNESIPAILNEITVDIGRDGELLYCGYGAHRLAIAKILDMDEICVKFGVRHFNWQGLRNEIRNKKQDQVLLGQYQYHPDLRDILTNQTQ